RSVRHTACRRLVAGCVRTPAAGAVPGSSCTRWLSCEGSPSTRCSWTRCGSAEQSRSLGAPCAEHTKGGFRFPGSKRTFAVAGVPTTAGEANLGADMSGHVLRPQTPPRTAPPPSSPGRLLVPDLNGVDPELLVRLRVLRQHVRRQFVGDHQA